MIYISVALFCEGKPFIDRFKLKKDTSFTKCQVFKNEDICLYITGTGSVNSAFFAGHILRDVHKGDRIFNIGVCGGDGVGESYLINKITDFETGYSYYPDILYKHSFNEGEIVTYPYVNKKKTDTLCDMESYGFYSGAKHFFDSSDIFIIKIVSDLKKGGNISTDFIEKIINENMDKIEELFNIPLEYSEKFTDDDLKFIDELSQKLKLSVTLNNCLRQYLYYHKLKGGEIRDFSTDLEFNKKEGREYFEKIRKSIL